MRKKPYQLYILSATSMLALTSIVEALLDMKVDFKIAHHSRSDNQNVVSVIVFCENYVAFQEIQKEFVGTV